MSVVDELQRSGGIAARGDLVRRTSRRELDAARVSGEVVRVARGRYGLPSISDGLAAAHALTGVLCLESAALHWGWAVKFPPGRPQVALPPNRKVVAEQTARVELRRLRFGPDDVSDGVTSPDRTLVDCLRMLDPDRALAVADSALREGYALRRLQALARDARGPGARQVRWVAAHADGRAANPFETTARYLTEQVEGLRVRPQVPLWGSEFLGRPDLVDVDLQIVIEADSFEWHGDRVALRNDARRYNGMVVHGWLVLRFSWEDVMLHPAQVLAILRAAVRERTERCGACRAHA
ncbi:DUF559 domain-containing protein [Nocardioides panacisoli]|uniref:DUF559 domain-containing protein n=1 Tax=Nocardioides panacisoli TaxID=627624 RepID=UPI001C629123|nr:DUF559 domain-containing protein [Nocardioides panacisoli]QYJ02749.1 DUF559 domain-containing protein [Nocardioides panacisoli]